MVVGLTLVVVTILRTYHLKLNLNVGRYKLRIKALGWSQGPCP